MQIKEFLNLGKIEFYGNENDEISGISYDSRSVADGFAFFALNGYFTDGKKFINQAIEKGAKLIISDAKQDISVSQIVVKDVFAFMSLFSAKFYRHPDKELTIIAVTGTNGKTSITYVTESILSAAGKNCGVIGTINYRYGSKVIAASNTTPQSADLYKMMREMADGGIKYLIMEVSSHALSLGRVAGMEFDTAVFTNLTQDHLDFHKDIERYFEAKSSLFKNLDKTNDKKNQKRAIINTDDKYGVSLACRHCQSSFHHCQPSFRHCGLDPQSPSLSVCASNEIAGQARNDGAVSRNDGVVSRNDGVGLRNGGKKNNDVQEYNAEVATYGIDDKTASFRAENINIGKDGSSFDLLFGTDRKKVNIEYIGLHNVYNVLACIAICFYCSIPIETIIEALKNAKPAPGRLERIDTKNLGFEVVVDYAHTDDALKNVLSALKQIKHNRILTVFGCGGDRDRTKRPIMGKTAADMSDFAFVTSDNPRTEDANLIILDIEFGIKKAGLNNYKVIADRETAIKEAVMSADKDDIILIAGKGHEDYQILGTQKIHFDDREIAAKYIALKEKEKEKENKKSYGQKEFKF